MCQKGYGYPFRYKVSGINEESEGNRLWLAAVLYQSPPLRYDPVTILIFICQKWRIKIKIQLLLGSSRGFAHSAQRTRELVIPSAFGRLVSDLTLQFRLAIFIHIIGCRSTGTAAVRLCNWFTRGFAVQSWVLVLTQNRRSDLSGRANTKPYRSRDMTDARLPVWVDRP
jgi:hypothetical protein